MILADQIEQKKVSQCLLECPPDYFYLLCDTPDRKQHFENVKGFLYWVRESLKAYFSGDKFEFPLDSNLIENDRKSKQFYKTYRKIIQIHHQLFLSLYDLIWTCWDKIQDELNKINFKSDSKENIFTFSIPLTPGETLNLIIRDFSVCLLKTAFPEYISGWGNSYSDFVPRNYHKNGKKYELIKHKIKSGKQITEEEAYFYKKIKSKFQVYESNLEPLNEWINFVIAVANKYKTKETRSKILGLQDNIEQMNELIYREVHPRKKLSNTYWRNGELKV